MTNTNQTVRQPSHWTRARSRHIFTSVLGHVYVYALEFSVACCAVGTSSGTTSRSRSCGQQLGVILWREVDGGVEDLDNEVDAALLVVIDQD